MNKLQKIQYNCRKATLLIEKQLIDRITTREMLELRIHLITCSICKTFQQQSIAINNLVRNLFKSEAGSDLKLDEDFKKGLQKRIDEKLEKS